MEHDYKSLLPAVHIFTDSKYALNASTSHSFRKKHYYIIQEIQNTAHRIKNANNQIKIKMHYVPSHIENTILGLRRTGNYYADKLATQGIHKAKPTDNEESVHNIRERILDETIALIEAIEKVRYI